MCLFLSLCRHQYKVRSLQDLVSLKDSDRRGMLRFLGEEKYDEVMAVLGSFPHISMETKLQGQSSNAPFFPDHNFKPVLTLTPKSPYVLYFTTHIVLCL